MSLHQLSSYHLEETIRGKEPLHDTLKEENTKNSHLFRKFIDSFSQSTNPSSTKKHREKVYKNKKESGIAKINKWDLNAFIRNTKLKRGNGENKRILKSQFRIHKYDEPPNYKTILKEPYEEPSKFEQINKIKEEKPNENYTDIKCTDEQNIEEENTEENRSDKINKTNNNSFLLHINQCDDDNNDNDNKNTDIKVIKELLNFNADEIKEVTEITRFIVDLDIENLYDCTIKEKNAYSILYYNIYHNENIYDVQEERKGPNQKVISYKQVTPFNYGVHVCNVSIQESVFFCYSKNELHNLNTKEEWKEQKKQTGREEEQQQQDSTNKDMDQNKKVGLKEKQELFHNMEDIWNEGEKRKGKSLENPIFSHNNICGTSLKSISCLQENNQQSKPFRIIKELSAKMINKIQTQKGNVDYGMTEETESCRNETTTVTKNETQNLNNNRVGINKCKQCERNNIHTNHMPCVSSPIKEEEEEGVCQNEVFQRADTCLVNASTMVGRLDTMCTFSENMKCINEEETQRNILNEKEDSDKMSRKDHEPNENDNDSSHTESCLTDSYNSESYPADSYTDSIHTDSCNTGSFNNEYFNITCDNKNYNDFSYSKRFEKSNMLNKMKNLFHMKFGRRNNKKEFLKTKRENRKGKKFKEDFKAEIFKTCLNEEIKIINKRERESENKNVCKQKWKQNQLLRKIKIMFKKENGNKPLDQIKKEKKRPGRRFGNIKNPLWKQYNKNEKGSFFRSRRKLFVSNSTNIKLQNEQRTYADLFENCNSTHSKLKLNLKNTTEIHEDNFITNKYINNNFEKIYYVLKVKVHSAFLSISIDVYQIYVFSKNNYSKKNNALSTLIAIYVFIQVNKNNFLKGIIKKKTFYEINNSVEKWKCSLVSSAHSDKTENENNLMGNKKKYCFLKDYKKKGCKQTDHFTIQYPLCLLRNTIWNVFFNISHFFGIQEENSTLENYFGTFSTNPPSSEEPPDLQNEQKIRDKDPKEEIEMKEKNKSINGNIKNEIVNLEFLESKHMNKDMEEEVSVANRKIDIKSKFSQLFKKKSYMNPINSNEVSECRELNEKHSYLNNHLAAYNYIIYINHMYIRRIIVMILFISFVILIMIQNIFVYHK